MNRVLLVLTTIATILATANAATALGSVYNALPRAITTVRVQLDRIAAERTLAPSASGGVLGDVAAGGRGHVYELMLAVSAPKCLEPYAC